MKKVILSVCILMAIVFPLASDSVQRKIDLVPLWFGEHSAEAVSALSARGLSLAAALGLLETAKARLVAGDLVGADRSIMKLYAALGLDPERAKRETSQYTDTIDHVKGRYGDFVANSLTTPMLEFGRPRMEYQADHLRDIYAALGVSPNQKKAILDVFKKVGPAGLVSALINNCSREQILSYTKGGMVDELERLLTQRNALRAGSDDWSFTIDALRIKGRLDRFWDSWELASMAGNPVYTKAMDDALVHADASGMVDSIRIWAFEASDIDKIYTEKNGKAVYDFSFVDRKIDRALTRKDRNLIVTLYGMPTALAACPAAKQLMIGMNMSYAKDFRKWRDFIQALLAHLEARYGIEAVRKWYFEFWNEPDTDWYGTRTWKLGSDNLSGDEYFSGLSNFLKMYDWTVAAFDAVDPACRIGTGAFSLKATDMLYGRENPFASELITHCARGRNNATGGVGTRLDFLSYHNYGVMNFAQRTEGFLRLLQNCPELARPKLLVTEYHGDLYYSYPSINTYDAVSRASVIDYALGLQDKGWEIVGLNTTFAIPFCPELLPETKHDGSTPLLFYGYSMMTWFLENDRVLPLPDFNMNRMLSMLGSQVLQSTGPGFGSLIRCIPTASGDRIALLFYNFDPLDIANQNRDTYTKKCSVHLSGLPAGRVKLTRYRISEDDNNFRLEWVRLGRPAPKVMSPEQWNRLEQVAGLSIIERKEGLRARGGSLDFEFTCESQSATLWLVEPDN
jgi:beta-xylosidase